MDAPLNISRSDPLQRYIASIETLVLDVGSGRLRPQSVEAADEIQSLGVRLSSLLREARRTK